MRSSVSLRGLIGILKSDYRIFFGGAGLSKLVSRFQIFCLVCVLFLFDVDQKLKIWLTALKFVNIYEV